MRVFIAINLPEEVKQELEKVKQEIIDSFPQGEGDRVGKWVKKENLHITLLFIGEVKDEKISEICDRVKTAVAQWQSFEVKINKVCYDAVSGGVPRLIWAELEKNKDLECIASSLGNKNFKGHITLARIKQWVWQRIEPEERPEIDRGVGLEFKVESVDVMESKLKRAGPEYNILESIKLK